VYGALVPALLSQPLLQSVKVDLRVGSTKTGYISFKSRFIEPAEHHVKLFAQDEPNKGQGQLLKLHGLTQDATEDLGRLGIGQFAARDLQLFSNEFGRALESQGHKRSDVVGRDRLIGLVSADGSANLPFRIPIST